MTNYHHYDAYELSRDPSFRAWVLHGSNEDATFWTNWLAQHPDRASTVEQAKAFVVAVQRQYQSSISEADVQAGVERIVAQVRAEAHPEPVAEPASIPLNSRRSTWVRWAAAAAVVLGVGLAWQQQWLKLPQVGAPSGPVVAAQSPWIDRLNTGRTPLTVLLNDGSVVTLEPGSRLRYPRRFAAAQRAVTLHGDAFFEVAHRPQQPFVVSTTEFTTTVLGTSFRVRSSGPDRQALVVVRSGKVAVQARQPAGTAAGAVRLSPVILVRDQQVVVETLRSQPLQKAPVQDKQLTINEINQEQVFDDVAVATVFDALEKQYGVTIQYDRAVLSRCFVNTAFGQENLRERLSAVCQAVGATYQITDEQVVITASGCTP